MNIDINTTQAAPALTITDDRHLCHVVYLLASHQLLINGAEAAMQAKVEAAKKAFADATAPIAEELKSLFAAVEIYAAANKARLFPVKGKKQSKTYKVLQHELKYRSSSAVEAVTNAAEMIGRMIEIADAWDSPDGLWNGIPKDEVRDALKALLRQPPTELDKDALLSQHEAKTPLSEALLGYLHLNGIRVKTSETFKLAFTFTPDQSAS